jgi:hypothetical protein
LPVDDATPAGGYLGYARWVRQHLDHVRLDLTEMMSPAAALADRAAMPWWR